MAQDILRRSATTLVETDPLLSVKALTDPIPAGGGSRGGSVASMAMSPSVLVRTLGPSSSAFGGVHMHGKALHDSTS